MDCSQGEGSGACPQAGEGFILLTWVFNLPPKYFTQLNKTNQPTNQHQNPNVRNDYKTTVNLLLFRLEALSLMYAASKNNQYPLILAAGGGGGA